MYETDIAPGQLKTHGIGMRFFLEFDDANLFFDHEGPGVRDRPADADQGVVRQFAELFPSR